jgi:hypothetical protein
MIHFEGPARAALARRLGLVDDAADPVLLACIQTRFPSWFEVKSFAQQEDIAFRTEVDFMP